MAYNKYKAVKTVVDGYKFDSKRESQRYNELKLMVNAGVIKGLELQPRFEILKGFTCKGKKYRPAYYVADFAYTENGQYVVEDVKGKRTDIFNLKMKMFLSIYGEKCDFRIVR